MVSLSALFRPSAERLVAVLLFVMSLALYCICLSPSASLWDCGEFILCSRWLEVGHPPGAPLYVMLARVFSLFASSADEVAWCVNMLSAVATALSVSLVFLIGVLLIRLVRPSASRSSVIVAAAVGSCAFAVCDTVWFSAVEAEVYALSLFFTTLTIYLLLRWKMCHDSHLLALIPLLVGLSAGVHLLNMLVLPVIAGVIFLEYHKHTISNLFAAFFLGFALLAFVVFGVISNGLQPAMILEMILSVHFGFPVHSGLFAYLFLLFGILMASLYFTRRMAVAHFVILSILLFSIGYSSNAYILIRSCANPTLNLNQPDNVFALNSVINREQYGQAPFVWGQWYGSRPSDIKSEVHFHAEGGGYESTLDPVAYIYPDDQKVFFPRMYSPAPHHTYGYSVWAGVDEVSTTPPSFADELRFMLCYQINFMYVRYLLWNFAGRQNDVRGIGDAVSGNWISGIPLVDSYLGQRHVLHPDEAHNPSRAVFFMLPFVLGVVGLCGLLTRRGSRYVAALLLLLFVLMGPAIAFYLNQQPFEPRERDYAYAGSFMVFSLFISLGAYYVMHASKRVLPAGRFSFALVAVALFMSVPVLMLAQNFRSHNRSGRMFDVALAKAYLSLCEPNAILFTEGDNDTFPLWYVQEVEGFRRDVRVVNYGLLGTRWYDSQIAKPHRGARGIDMKRLFEPSEGPVYVIPNGEAMSDFDCAAMSVDYGLIARVLNASDSVSAIERICLFADAVHFPSASDYHLSYDVVNTFERIRYRPMSCQLASEALSLGEVALARRLLLSSLDAFPVWRSPMADGNVDLALLLYRVGEDALSRQVLRQLASYYIEAVNYVYADSESHTVRASQMYISMQPFALSLVDALRQTHSDDVLSAVLPYVENEKTAE